MRVAFLHGSNDLYGASRVLVQDVEALTSAGVGCAVVLPDEGPLTELLRAAGAHVEISPLRVLRKVDLPRGLVPPSKLPSAAAEADVVVVWTLALVPYLPLCRALGRPAITSVHEILPSAAGTAVATLAGILSSAVMANSQTTAAWFRRCWRRVHVAVAYPVAPPYDPLPGVHLEGTLRALLAGRVNGHKGHLEAIDAVQMAREIGADVELTLLGGCYPGQERHLEAMLTALEDAPAATYKGEVRDVRPYLAACDVMLIPTVTPEPFGVVALEAWGAGRRVIASRTGGLAEAAEMVEGVQVTPSDAKSLAAALVKVAGSPNLRRSPSRHAPVARVCTQEARLVAWERTLARAASRRIRPNSELTAL